MSATPAAPPELSAASVAQLMAFAESIAREAGHLVQQDRPARVAVVDTKSSPTDVVTQMDRAAESLLRERIAATRPNDSVLGEESGLAVGAGASPAAGSGLTWVLDPIDGTVNYLYGIPAYAVSVAVVTGDPTVAGAWQSVAGCVHNPASGLTWTAGLGQGAFLDGVPLHTPDPPATLAGALVGTGFGYRQARRRAQAAVVAGVLPLVRDIRRIGSAALDLCHVATGRLDAYYEQGLNPWDLAAGVLVVSEAGGEVSGTDGLPPGERMLVAARSPLLGQLVTVLEGLDAAADS